ncbi:PREDICTED: UPF0481 protein At3g47200-like [Fragaria vesca subsp. vesca]|uniref:UPF0481 protein At3g47200-like n=1 Tax=Fragaria vesca subsp. vesca TaxID=101020 RepID=UPI0002C2DD76|nr:PREDICTED: UPF0481 protein At3g47200-like [Fragaria vesca subsp. vesca]
MAESKVKEHCLIEIREGEESVTAGSNVKNQTLSGDQNKENVNIASSIRKKLLSKAPSPSSTCIYRVPDVLKKLHEKDFVPCLVSIGPFHHGTKKLQAMEQFKLWYLHQLLDRKPNPETNLEHIVEKIRSLEDYSRECYNEKLDDLSSEAFVEMMVVDGCFILEYYRKKIGEVPTDPDDPLFNITLAMSPTLTSDLVMLENQLPWRVLDCLFQLTKQVPNGTCKSLSELTRSCLPIRGPVSDDHLEQTTESRHLLDNVRILSAELDKKEEIMPFWDSMPSATKLQQIGVMFQPNRNNININITFVDGVLEIAPITIQGDNPVFRNLIALEQCESGPHKYQISTYARALCDLIKSSKDVEFLKQNQIIHTSLNKEDIAGFFDDICNGFETSSCCKSFWQVSSSVRQYYKQHWLQRLIVYIKHNYLYNPSSIWSVSNAVVLIIILTVLQTIYSILSYYKS